MLEHCWNIVALFVFHKDMRNEYYIYIPTLIFDL